ncbi:gamma-glutamyltransferase 5a [Pundamilia nyererei]|uniref:Gamma-glutamyltransferase 5a n=1 Tax=Pundamilia nyererei TaxID=303518 RepID=A0A9Y6M040_9CICH|nr:PREDICTED: gamma-glutamyltransferase 5-like [Pundamilia nyererei]
MAESTEHVEGGNLSPISPLNEDTEDEDVGGANTTPMCPPNEDVKDEDVESAKTTCNCPPKVPCILVVVVGAVFLIVGALAAGLPAGFIGFWKGKSECVKDPSANCPFSKAAVAADSEKCSRIGRDILQKGGSAVDAAIAALLCTSIINPQCAGIGGGVIFTVMDSSGKVKIINSRETVPRKVTSDLLKSCPETTKWSMKWPQGGKLTLEDLALYQANVTDAWNISLGEYRMYFPPPPAGGTILSLILNIMKGYKMESEPNTTDEKILFYHRYIEALKFANGLKKHIRDPNFSSDKMAKNLTEDSFANHIRSLISSDKTHDPQYYGKNSYLDSIGTTHVSVLAEDGSAVSVTSSINDEFGSNVLSSSTGIILNNHLNDFCGRADNIFHVDGLEALGHKVAKFYNTVNAVEKAGNCISAWSDERKNGKAAGY